MVRRHEGTAFMGGAHVFPGRPRRRGRSATATHVVRRHRRCGARSWPTCRGPGDRVSRRRGARAVRGGGRAARSGSQRRVRVAREPGRPRTLQAGAPRRPRRRRLAARHRRSAKVSAWPSTRCPLRALGDAADRHAPVRHALLRRARTAAPDASARRDGDHAQRVDAARQTRSRRRWRRHRAAAADVDDAPRARGIRDGGGGDHLGAPAAHRPAHAAGVRKKAGGDCSCCRAIRSIPIRRATNRRSRRASCSSTTGGARTARARKILRMARRALRLALRSRRAPRLMVVLAACARCRRSRGRWSIRRRLPSISALLPQIARIKLFDHHAHPAFPDDADVDIAPPPPGSTPLRLRPTIRKPARRRAPVRRFRSPTWPARTASGWSTGKRR